VSIQLCIAILFIIASEGRQDIAFESVCAMALERQADLESNPDFVAGKRAAARAKEPDPKITATDT
jgi:hypothetical protein